MKMKWKRLWVVLLSSIVLIGGLGLKAEAVNMVYDYDNVHDGTVGQGYEAVVGLYVNNEEPVAVWPDGTIPPGLTVSVDKYMRQVVISGTPTKAGTYKFKLWVEGKSMQKPTPEFTVRIAAANIGYSISASGCVAKHADGSNGTLFYAGEEVKLQVSKSITQYVDRYDNNAKLKIATGKIGEKIYGTANTFYMPAQDVSVTAVLKDKNLGTYEHNAVATTDSDDLCGLVEVRSMILALDLGIVKNIGMIEETVKRTDTDAALIKTYKIDLDKDGHADIEMQYDYNERFYTGGYPSHMKALDGRNLYGSYTVNIPVNQIYEKCSSGLYSKIVFNLGKNPTPAHTHSFKAVAGKDATCTADGVKTHYECACGQWAWDEKGSSPISNHADVTVKALGHDMKVVANKAATCTEDGNLWHCECKRCGNWYWDNAGTSLIPEANHSGLILKATGHKWGEWTVEKPATVEEEGVEVRVCQNDASHKETRTVAKLPAPETTEAPTTEAPTTEAPTEPPTTEAPATEPPATEPPATQAPETQAPATQAPETKAPETQAPATQAPETKAPETQAPQPEKGGSGNTGLYIAIAGLAAVCGVLAGILIGKKKKEEK